MAHSVFLLIWILFLNIKCKWLDSYCSDLIASSSCYCYLSSVRIVFISHFIVVVCGFILLLCCRSLIKWKLFLKPVYINTVHSCRDVMSFNSITCMCLLSPCFSLRHSSTLVMVFLTHVIHKKPPYMHGSISSIVYHYY